MQNSPESTIILQNGSANYPYPKIVGVFTEMTTARSLDRLKTAILLFLACTSLAATADSLNLDNPIVLQRADPWIHRDESTG